MLFHGLATSKQILLSAFACQLPAEGSLYLEAKPLRYLLGLYLTLTLACVIPDRQACSLVLADLPVLTTTYRPVDGLCVPHNLFL